MNFTHGHPFFAVSIGLLEHGKPVSSAVVAPALATEWRGYVGGGAFGNAKPCQVSPTDKAALPADARGHHLEVPGDNHVPRRVLPQEQPGSDRLVELI